MIWENCSCRGHSMFGRTIKKVTVKWRTWRASNPETSLPLPQNAFILQETWGNIWWPWKIPLLQFQTLIKGGADTSEICCGSNQMVNIWLYRMSLLSYPEGIFCPWTTWQLPICSKFSFIFRTIFDILIMTLDMNLKKIFLVEWPLL